MTLLMTVTNTLIDFQLHNIMLSYSNTPIQCNCDDQKTGFIDDNILMSKEHLPVKDLYFGGSSWSISWLNYVLGPMKCFGKQQLYPPDAEKLKKQTNEQKLIDVANKAQSIRSPTMTDSIKMGDILEFNIGDL